MSNVEEIRRLVGNINTDEEFDRIDELLDGMDDPFDFAGLPSSQEMQVRTIINEGVLADFSIQTEDLYGLGSTYGSPLSYRVELTFEAPVEVLERHER